MVLDTSALIAVLDNEPPAPQLAAAMADADRLKLSAASLVEATIVIESRRGPEGTAALDSLLNRARAATMPVDEDQAREARRADQRFGKGRHRAGLNFGDCFAYALAATLDEPLLFVGSDFTETDLTPVL